MDILGERRDRKLLANVIAAADEVYNKEKGNAKKTVDVYLVFQPSSTLGEADKKSVKVKTYHLTAN